jgi:tRNA U34 5-methylaminomethyl-2-thiouridine-forming methyltransferase MnmC
VEKRKGRRKRRCLTISSISTTINIADNCFKM